MSAEQLPVREGTEPIESLNTRGGDGSTLPGEPTVAGTHAFRGLAIGALAFGALAIGALAIGRLAVGRLSIGRSRIRRLEIEELDVERMRVNELQIVDGPSNRRPDR
jgi:hypothetical protein